MFRCLLIDDDDSLKSLQFNTHTHTHIYMYILKYVSTRSATSRILLHAPDLDRWSSYDNFNSFRLNVRSRSDSEMSANR